jgi:septal ring factor EnvC (AmiA/AmiB activator)
MRRRGALSEEQQQLRTERATTRRRSAITAAVLIALTLTFTSAPSQTARDADLQRIRGEIADLRNRLEGVRKQAQSAQQEIEASDLELGIRTRELQIAVESAAQLEQERQQLEGQIARISPQIAQQKVFLARRLGAMYRLGGLSYVRLLLSMDQPRDPLGAMSLLTYLVSRDARAVQRFQATRVQLGVRSNELADRQHRLAQVRQVVEQRRVAVATAREEKEKLLLSLRSEDAQSTQRLAELEEKARRLQRLVGVLSQKPATAQPNLGDIRGVQGSLGWPVQGKIIERFGRHREARFSTVTTSNGIKIGTAAGSSVHAVYTGTVLFSQWFKGYGNLIILDHGNRVFSLYGNLKAPTVTSGDRIATGQTIAGAGESEDQQSGYLYFEIRQDNKPEDPQKWLR